MPMSEQDKINYRRKYNEENYARIGLYLKPEEKKMWQSEARARGESLNDFIKTCVNKEISERRA